MEQQVKVGVFDSGVGGLTVVTEILKKLPWVSVVYFGDTAHVPYGEKSVEQLIRYGDQICSFFMEENVAGILAACNTSSSVSLPFLQEKYPQVPIIGVVEPGVKLAVAATVNNRVGVIATEATVKSRSHQLVAARLAKETKVFLQGCPKFVPLVEAGDVAGPATREAAREYLTPLIRLEIDTLILGCTHYPFLKAVIREIVGGKVKLVDPAEIVVENLAQALQEKGYTKANHVAHHFYVSGDCRSFQEVGQRLVGASFLPVVTGKNVDC